MTAIVIELLKNDVQSKDTSNPWSTHSFVDSITKHQSELSGDSFHSTLVDVCKKWDKNKNSIIKEMVPLRQLSNWISALTPEDIEITFKTCRYVECVNFNFSLVNLFVNSGGLINIQIFDTREKKLITQVDMSDPTMARFITNHPDKLKGIIREVITRNIAKYKHDKIDGIYLDARYVLDLIAVSLDALRANEEEIQQRDTEQCGSAELCSSEPRFDAMLELGCEVLDSVVSLIEDNMMMTIPRSAEQHRPSVCSSAERLFYMVQRRLLGEFVVKSWNIKRNWNRTLRKTEKKRRRPHESLFQYFSKQSVSLK
jgi:hypothetical protein